NKLIGLSVDQGVLNALAENKGLIKADGGQVLLTAKAADQIIKSVVNNDGIIEATRLTNVDGVIRLEADNISNSGTLRADGGVGLRGGSIAPSAAHDITLGASSILSASGASGGDITAQAQGGTLLADGRIQAVGNEATGGAVKLLGTQVGLINSASVNASGSTGGGTVLVGGDYQGKNPDVQNATSTYVGAGANINVDAIGAGNGGKAIVWANDSTRFYGNVFARGGANGGDGGFVETSGKNVLQATGTVDASARAGQAGSWLLDPNNISIQSAGANTSVVGSPDFYSTNDSAIVTTGSILTALNAGTSVTVTTGSAGTNAQAGNITVANAIGKTAGGNATLTLNAANDISFNAGADVTSSAGQLNLTLSALGNVSS